MHFSEHFAVSKTLNDDWFDTILDVDTPVFIDPFLIFRRPTEHFANGHKELVRFFQVVFDVAAASGGNPSSPAYGKLHNLLLFPEVDELCLGYVAGGTRGSGTARKFGKAMAAAVLRAIEHGLTNLSHFEEIGIFNIGIGPDRISDITANILKPRFAAYTQAVCKRHSIPMQPSNLSSFGINEQFHIWNEEEVQLPTNPHTGDPILLTPAQYLRELPVLNADDFWHYVYDTRDSDQLRHDLNFDIVRNLDKKAIIKIASEHQAWVTEYVRFVEDNIDPQPYDLRKDRAGLVGWSRASREYVAAHPRKLDAASDAEFRAVIEDLLRQFRHFVEETGGYRLLWNDDNTPKPEDAAQLLFFGIAKEYCRANNIDVSKEANLGSGPVDFKFSSGYRARTLIEVKLARNSRFWNGLDYQLPKYLKVEEIRRGYFLIICHTVEERRNKLADLETRVREAAALNKLDLEAIAVDATQVRTSASKLKG